MTSSDSLGPPMMSWEAPQKLKTNENCLKSNHKNTITTSNATNTNINANYDETMLDCCSLPANLNNLDDNYNQKSKMSDLSLSNNNNNNDKEVIFTTGNETESSTS